MKNFASTVTEIELMQNGFVQIPGGVDAEWVRTVGNCDVNAVDVLPCIGLTYVRNAPEFALFDGTGSIFFLNPQSWEQVDMLEKMIVGFESSIA
ncbi:hypothetical protein [Larkinella sp. C7]|uniref:hypothetical protein n=1 Tax=Larkinella sp. C7 TaxID=2576607 RepID=UPI0011113AD9|nr:hypothetical protein [Larkinella sp. C7]